MNIANLLQDVNIVLDWHDNGDFLDCYQESEENKVKKVLMIWRGSLYYDAAREFIQQHFEVGRRAVKENKMYRRELPQPPLSLDDYDFGDDVDWFIYGEKTWTECSNGEDALAEVQKMITSGDATADGLEIIERRNVTRTWELDQLIADYGEKEPA